MSRLLNFIKAYWLYITLTNFVVITVLSLYPLEHLPTDIPGNDKTHHFIAYSALVFPVALRKPAHWKLIFFFFVIWSGAIELLQPYANRYGEWLDMAANTAGVFSGLLVAQLFISTSKNS